MKTIKLIFLLFGFFLVSTQSFAQKTEFYADQLKQIEVAKELFRQGKYNAAYGEFEKIQAQVEKPSGLYSEAEYYKAYSILKSGQNDGDRRMNDFIDNYPESPYANTARLNLGGYHFDKQRFSQAIKTLSLVNRSQLDKKSMALLHFQLGYSYLMEEDQTKALAEFAQIKDTDNPYNKAAAYYWAHINYLQGNNDAALEGFTKLNGDPVYSKTIPLYVSHIFYKQEKYSQIVQYTPGILDDVDEESRPELEKIVGDSYFRLNQYKEALPYLEKFQASKLEKSDQDNYAIAFCYYSAGEYSNAVPYFQKASKSKDEMAQNAYYHLADCLVRLGDKQKARVAFEAASEMDFDETIKEDALFNYAKITYELSYSPFSETIKAFDKYISLYPNSERNSTAYQYLVDVYMVTRNYADAMSSIEKIKVKNPSINKAYQRVAFYRGLEQFNDQDYNEAIRSFNKSIENGAADRELNARALYWKAESLYRLGDYNSAISEYNRFLQMPGAGSTAEYNDAPYSLGYAYFKLEDYTSANSFFRKYISANQGKRTTKMADAMNRVGDGFFIVRDFQQAAGMYNQSYTLKLYDPDYALYQAALCSGLLRDYSSKVSDLRELLTNYKTSEYRDDAMYELGRAYERLNQNADAAGLYSDIIKNYKQSTYYKKALLQLGLINYNNGNYTEAIRLYKEVAEKFQNTDEATAALSGIKNCYVELNDIDSYFAYAQQLGRGAVSATEQDALIYKAAERQFMAGEKDAVTRLKRYLSDFPYGAYVLNARFYLAEALYNGGNYSEAYEHYQYVAGQSDNIFTEPAVAKAAELALNQKDFAKALAYYKHLEVVASSPFNKLNAYTGQMRCSFELKNYREAILAAQQVQEEEKTNAGLLREAGYITAKSEYNLGDFDKALPSFKKIAAETNSAEGAEAKFMVSDLLFRKQQNKQAEDEIMDFISKGTPHQYWLGKSFILLSDIYVANGDTFRAKHTLKSVIENYGNKTDGIVSDASARLATIEAKEKSGQ